MAVEIPVYIDIKGAIDRAAKEIPSDIKELQSVIYKNTLQLEFDVTGGNKMKLQEMLLGDTSISDLKRGLHSIREEFDKMSQKAATNKNPKEALKLTNQVRELARAYGLVEQRITGVASTNTVAAMMVQNNINKVKAKLNELRATLATQSQGTEAYNQTNYAIKIQQQRLAELNKQYISYKAGLDSTNSSMTKQHSILTKLAAQFGVYLSVHSLIRFVKSIRDVTGELEYQRVALGHLIQDVDKGNELFGRLIEAAKESPFRIKDLVTYTKQLAAYRIEEDELFDTTMKLADISAGLGVSMDRLILAYGQVRAASVLRGQELRQFTEAGIPLVDELAKKFTKLKGTMVSTADVFKLISQRAVPFEYIKEIFDDLTSAGGMFYKMQEEQAKTLKGRWEKLKDAYDKALMSIGENNTFQKWNDNVLKALNAIANSLTGIVRVANAAGIAWATYKVATTVASTASFKLVKALTKEYGMAGLLTAAVNGLTVAWKKFTAWFNANWVGLALSAVAGLITYFTTFRKQTEAANKELSDMEQAIQKMKQANKDLAYGKELINSYEELSAKTNRTANENERLKTVIGELKTLYPEVANSIDTENRALEEQIGLLRDAAEANHNYAVEEARKMLDTQKQVIRGLEDEAAAAKLAYDSAIRRKEAAESAEAAGYVQRATSRGIEVVSDAKQLKKETIDAANAASAAQAEYEGIASKLAEAKKTAEELEAVIDPKKKTKDWQQWAKQINEIQEEMMELGDTPVFTPEELQNFTSVSDMADKLKKKIEDLTESIAAMTVLYDSMTDKGSEAAIALSGEIDNAKKTLSIAETIKAALGLTFSKSNSSYTQDPFIAQMQERMKFMQDFKKGYDDLNKYMDKSNALEKESNIMLTRGLSLGIDVVQQKRAAEDLSEWYDDAIQTAFKEAQKHGARGSVLDFLSQQIKDSSGRGKALKDFQKLIQSLWDAKTDIDTSTLKEEMEDALKKVEDEVKRSETAHNFFQNILDLTGDQDLAATMTMSVYGDVGKDFKGRVQDQLNAALNSLDWAAMDDATFGNLSMATITQDFQTILEYIDLFPEEWQKVLKQMASDTEKNNADWYTDFIKTFRKAKTYEERINTLEQQKQQKLREMEGKAGVTEADRAAVEAYYAKQIADVQLEAMKDTYTWTKAFEDLEGVSDQTLNNLINLIDEYVEKYGKDLEPQQLKELARSRENAKQQLLSRNAYKATGNAIKDLISASKRYTDLQAEGEEGTEDVAKAADDYREALKRLSDSLNQVYSDMDDVVSKTKDLMNVFASDDDASYFSEQLDNITKTVKGAGTAAVGIGRMLLGDISPQAIMQTLTGLTDVVTGIFGGVNAKQVRDANKEYDRQAKILQTLDRTYNKLEKSIGEAFGNDAVTRFTEQLKVLQAQQDAYLAQAANREEAAQKESTKKNKKRYAEEAEEAKAQAMEVGDAMASLRYEISSTFAGSDLSSAAESFADAWLEAYQEFGNTSTAIEERMTEMVQNIVKKAALSGIAQSVLGNWYDSLADVTDWNAQTIAEKWKEAMGLVGPMVEGMQVFANSMQAEGVSLRNTVGQFTGISRDIAGASEESINGLAAGINTQNFYMSFMPLIHENVAQILTYMTGGNTVSPATESGIEGMPSVQTLVNTHLPNIDANINSILQLLRSVISVGNVAPRNYVATKM